MSDNQSDNSDWRVKSASGAFAKAHAAVTDIHSCGPFCTRPACVLSQRDELRAQVAGTPT